MSPFAHAGAAFILAVGLWWAGGRADDDRAELGLSIVAVTSFFLGILLLALA